VISASVPNFIEIKNTWWNPFAQLAWNDPITLQCCSCPQLNGQGLA